MKFVIILLISDAFFAASSCPSTWTSYKSTKEGPFDAANKFLYYVQTIIWYRCANDAFSLKSKHELLFPNISNVIFLKGNELGDCRGACNSKNVTVNIQYKDCRYHACSTYNTATFQYINRNCDKLHWSSWSMVTDCSKSFQATFTRKCVDCNGDEFYYHLINGGQFANLYCSENETKHEDCRPSWSAWSDGPCLAPKCHTVGSRIRTRTCMYGDKSEAFDSQLCSNESATVRTNCISNNTSCASTSTFVSNKKPTTSSFVSDKSTPYANTINPSTLDFSFNDTSIFISSTPTRKPTPNYNDSSSNNKNTPTYYTSNSDFLDFSTRNNKPSTANTYDPNNRNPVGSTIKSNNGSSSIAHLSKQSIFYICASVLAAVMLGSIIGLTIVLIKNMPKTKSKLPTDNESNAFYKKSNQGKKISSLEVLQVKLPTSSPRCFSSEVSPTQQFNQTQYVFACDVESNYAVACDKETSPGRNENEYEQIDGTANAYETIEKKKFVILDSESSSVAYDTLHHEMTDKSQPNNCIYNTIKLS